MKQSLSNLKNKESKIKEKIESDTTKLPKILNNKFNIVVGSYEHTLLCLCIEIFGKTKTEIKVVPIFHIEAHKFSVKSIDIAKKYLVSGSSDDQIKIYDIKKNKEIGHLLCNNGSVTKLQFTPEVDLEGKKNQIKQDKWLFSATESGKIDVWRTKDWELITTLKGHKDRVNDIDIHPSGKLAISVSDDYRIRLWNLMTGKKAAALKFRSYKKLKPEQIKWSLSGDFFVVSTRFQLLFYRNCTAKVYNTANLKNKLNIFKLIYIDNVEWLVLGLENGSIEFYDFNNSFINTGSDEYDPENILQQSNIISPNYTINESGSRIKDIDFYIDPVSNKVFIISASSDGSVSVWDSFKNNDHPLVVYQTSERLNCVRTYGFN